MPAEPQEIQDIEGLTYGPWGRRIPCPGEMDAFSPNCVKIRGAETIFGPGVAEAAPEASRGTSIV